MTYFCEGCNQQVVPRYQRYSDGQGNFMQHPDPHCPNCASKDTLRELAE